MYRGKRFFDFTVAFFGILFLSPLLLVIYLSVLVSSGRPAIYIQKRVGKNWKIFKLYKFRTMIVGAEKQGYICKKDDERVTPIGRLLRKYKLDELPQLFNVLKGDMSFVGPRPEILEFTQHYKDQFKEILVMKPGITDAASIRFRDEARLIGKAENIHDFYLEEILSQKTRLSCESIEKENILYDLHLISKTLLSVFSKNENY